MKTLMILAVIALTIAGCSYQGDTKNYDNSYTDNTVDYGSGTLLICTDSNCSVAPKGTDKGDADVEVGVYDADYTETECKAAGFPWCSIDNVCINAPRDTA